MNKSIQNRLQMSANFKKRTKRFQRSGNSTDREKSNSSLRSQSSKANIRSCILPFTETMKAKSNKNISTDKELIIICPNCQTCMIKVKNGQYSTEQISGKYNSLMLNRESKKKSQKVLEKDANNILKMSQDKGIIKLKSALSKLKIEQLESQNKSLKEEIKFLQSQLSHTQSLEDILAKSQQKINDLNHKNAHLHHQYAFQQKSLLQELDRLKISKDQAYIDMKQKYKQLMSQYMKLFKANIQLVSKKERNRVRDEDSTELEEQSFLISEDDTSQVLL